MKKIFLLVTALLLTGVAVNAEKRTKSQILSAAAEVLQDRTIMTSAPGLHAELQILDNSFSQLSVVGYKSGSYVIVANDDAMPAVIGYSESKYDLRNAAPAFLWYMELANKNIQECLANGTSLPVTDINPEYKPEVPQLCTTEWGQDKPYNLQTPLSVDGKNYVTGCVATAMAQIMKHYNYPEMGRGRVKYTNSPADDPSDESQSVKFYMDEEPFKWDDMLDIYQYVDYSKENAEAVAYLMKCTGGSVQMRYARRASGAYTTDTPAAFYSYFYYDQGMDVYNGDYYSKKEWYDIAYGALSKGYPLLFGASSTIGGQDAGHSFVVDGYSKDGKVHVNFGWDGNSDGYYSLLNMHGYDHGFEMVPVYKPLPELVLTSKIGLFRSNMSYVRGEVSANLINYSSRNFTGRIALLLKNLSDGSEQMIDYMDFKDQGYTSGGNNLNILDYVVNADLPSDLADGEYRLFLASKGSWTIQDDPTSKHPKEYTYQEKAWQPVRCSDGLVNSYIITVTNGVAKSKPEKDAAWVLGIDNVITKEVKSDIVKVFDVEGRMIYTSKSADFRIADVPTEGLLIIKEGDNVRKVIK